MATATAGLTSPLTPTQYREIAGAHDRARKVRRVASVAGFNGWSIGVFAALSAPFALFSPPGMLLTLGMGVVAYNEFWGKRRLLRFEPAAATFLGWNQIGFLALLTAYCLWMLLVGVTGESPFEAELAAKPELRDVIDSIDGFEDLYRGIVVGFYGLVIAMSVVFQGGNAWYYFSRRRVVEAYRLSTPEWVREVQNATARD